MADAEKILSELITTKGPNHLQKAPMSVYKALLEDDVAPKLARILLSALLADAAAKAQALSAQELSTDLQNSCGLQEDAAEEAAQIFSNLFSPASIESRKALEGTGFREFCKTVWKYWWAGDATWRSGVAHIDCIAEAEASITVEDVKLAQKAAAKLLEMNPFVSADAIRTELGRRLSAKLDSSLEDYVTAEKYYAPYMEDYAGLCESDLRDCCKKFGLRLECCSVDVDSTDYISD